MNEETGQIARSPGRSFQAYAFGDTAAAIEMDALDKARAFFGAGWRLRVEPDYLAYPPSNRLRAEHNGAVGQFFALVTVSLVEPEADQ